MQRVGQLRVSFDPNKASKRIHLKKTEIKRINAKEIEAKQTVRSNESSVPRVCEPNRVSAYIPASLGRSSRQLHHHTQFSNLGVIEKRGGCTRSALLIPLLLENICPFRFISQLFVFFFVKIYTRYQVCFALFRSMD